MTVVLKDGRKLNKVVKQAIGSVEVPMTDAMLEAKFSDLADGILPAPQVRRLMDACWNIEKMPSAGGLAQLGVL